MPGFGLLNFLGSSSNLPVGQRIRKYADLDEVSGDFGSGTEEYQAAEIFFAQSPQPDQLAISRWFKTAVGGELLCGSTPDTVIGDWNAITNGSLSLTVDGSAVTLTAMDFSGQGTLSLVAALIQTTLRGVKTGTTVVWNGTQFIITSGTTGHESSVGFSTTPSGGTDIGPLMAARGIDHAVASIGVDAETITTALQSIQDLDDTWFWMAVENGTSDDDIQAAALWAEAEEKIFGFTTADSGVADPTSSSDIVSVLHGKTYAYTLAQYDPGDKYAVISAIARMVTVDFNQPNSTLTLKFKLEPGITPLPINTTVADTLDAKCCNYYTYFADSAMLTAGVQVGGRWTDEVYGLAWLRAAVQNAVFGYLYTSTTKVPQTDKGVQRIVQQIEVAMHQAVVNGLLAPGLWEGPELDDPISGATIVANMEFLPLGYFVYAAPCASQSQQQRSARIAPPITILAKGAGAIQFVSIVINFEQ